MIYDIYIAHSWYNSPAIQHQIDSNILVKTGNGVLKMEQFL